jgi:hypothetical protein
MVQGMVEEGKRAGEEGEEAVRTGTQINHTGTNILKYSQRRKIRELIFHQVISKDQKTKRRGGGSGCKFIFSRYSSYLVTGVPVVAKHAYASRARRKPERDESAESEPVSVAVLGSNPMIAVDVACNAKDDHIDDPDDERRQRGQRGGEGHEHGAETVVACTANAKDPCDSSKSSGLLKG